MNKALVSTGMHILELAVSILAAYLITRLFNLNNEAVIVIIGFVLNSLSKFARAYDEIPVNDFVNN